MNKKNKTKINKNKTTKINKKQQNKYDKLYLTYKTSLFDNTKQGEVAV